MNCTGERCIMQYDKVDPKTCKCLSYCPYATPPIDWESILMLIARIWSREIDEEKGNFGVNEL